MASEVGRSKLCRPPHRTGEIEIGSGLCERLPRPVHHSSPQPFHRAEAKLLQPTDAEDHLQDVDSDPYAKGSGHAELAEQSETITIEHPTEDQRLHEIIGESHSADGSSPCQEEPTSFSLRRDNDGCAITSPKQDRSEAIDG